MISANKGEWSELYVLLKLLGEKKIHAGDGDLNKLDVVYPVLKILRDELERHMEYALDRDIVLVTEDNVEIARVTSEEFLAESQKLFKNIQKGGKGAGAFEIPAMDTFLKKIHCEKVKAKSQDKADIHIVIHDYHTGMQPNLGFSIKSEAGAAPTLLNASPATRFVFEVKGGSLDKGTVDAINAINTRGKAMDRVNAIYNKGLHLEFSSVPNSVFRGNLRMIDMFLPAILGWMLQDAYHAKDLNIRKAVKDIRDVNPLGLELEDGHDLYGYKIKSMMVAIALGMLPATPWNGRYDATGGYIVVKEDGDVVCFHIYDRNMLEDYLYKNTKFETPSTTRHDFGYIYQKDDKYFFDLVMQIRFK